MSRTSKNKSGNRPTKSELLQATPEQIKRQDEALNTSVNKNKNMNNSIDSESGFYNSFISFISITFIILGMIALGVWGWIQITTMDDKPAPEVTPTSFFYAELDEEVTVSTSTQLVSKMAAAKQTLRPEVGSFSNIWITKEGGGKLSSQEFINKIIDTSLPTMDYIGQEFMYGEYTQRNKTTPYIVFSVTDYEGAYGSLLQTENRFASALSKLGFQTDGDFRDVIIQNQDVRKSVNQSEQGVFYSFPRQNRLVITYDKATLKEIFRRLQQTNYQTGE